jgi:hypothetical protein
MSVAVTMIDTPAPKLLLSAADAAKALSIGGRKLSQLTGDGAIPCVRLGWRVLYDPRDLQRWIDDNKTTGNAPPRRDRSAEHAKAG